MIITVNGKEIKIPSSCTLQVLIDELQFQGNIAIEVNHQIIPRSRYDQCHIQIGDAIEVVQAVGGG